MTIAMALLAVLCTVMGLIVLVPGLRDNLMQPAVTTLIDGLDYAAMVMEF